jgi:hypothetical protein
MKGLGNDTANDIPQNSTENEESDSGNSEYLELSDTTLGSEKGSPESGVEGSHKNHTEVDGTMEDFSPEKETASRPIRNRKPPSRFRELFWK